MSSHSLAVESGRWHKPNKIPRNERKCFICDDIEDEYHFVLECPLYNDLRKKYVKNYFRNRPSMFKFLELMKEENINIIRQLSNFLNKAIKSKLTPVTILNN